MTARRNPFLIDEVTQTHMRVRKRERDWRKPATDNPIKLKDKTA
jgi:hypothetical protein